MRAYVITTGTIFGLIVVAHIWRMFIEGAVRAKDPIYWLLTLLALALSLWAWRLVVGSPNR